jgi:hypothetical protein
MQFSVVEVNELITKINYIYYVLNMSFLKMVFEPF